MLCQRIIGWCIALTTLSWVNAQTYTLLNEGSEHDEIELTAQGGTTFTLGYRTDGTSVTRFYAPSGGFTYDGSSSINAGDTSDYQSYFTIPVAYSNY